MFLADYMLFIVLHMNKSVCIMEDMETDSGINQREELRLAIIMF